MKFTTISGKELSAEELRRWSDIQRRHPAFASPFFSAEFIAAVAEVRDDVFVGVLQADEGTAGFFPFQTDAGRVGRPVGGILSDYQGVVADTDEWDAGELIRGCKLERWEFNHLIASQEPFRAHHVRKWVSPAVNLSHGYEAYSVERRASRSGMLKRLGALRRKLEREVGPLRYEAHVSDTKELHGLMRCKSAQYRRRNGINVFSWSWAVELIERIHAIETENFAGMLSALYAGDELVASHMGMRSRDVWHYWFPCYRQKFAAYSPGLILLLEMIQSAQQLGIRLIDLGRGEHPYKKRFMNTSVSIAEGLVTAPSSAVVWAEAQDRKAGYTDEADRV
jgi:CelD/BcsL family acetyltransferase involved in cellulose biosynthesis